MSELRKEIKAILKKEDLLDRDFPKSWQAMTSKFARLKSLLQTAGITREDDIQHPEKRAFRLQLNR